MGFLAGFTQGLGNYAQDMSKKMLDLRTMGYTHMSDLYSKLAENYKTNPSLMGEYLNRATAFQRAAMNPFDRNAASTVKGMDNPGEPLQNFLSQHINNEHQAVTGQPAPKEFMPWPSKQTSVPGVSQPTGQPQSQTGGQQTQSQGSPQQVTPQQTSPQSQVATNTFQTPPQPTANETGIMPSTGNTSTATAPMAPSGFPAWETINGPKPDAYRQTSWGTMEPNPAEAEWFRGKQQWDTNIAQFKARQLVLGGQGGAYGNLSQVPGSTLNRVLQNDAMARDMGLTTHPWVEPKTVTLSDAGGPPQTYIEHKGTYYSMDKEEPVHFKGPVVQTTLFRQPVETTTIQTKNARGDTKTKRSTRTVGQTGAGGTAPNDAPSVGSTFKTSTGVPQPAGPIDSTDKLEALKTGDDTDKRVYEILNNPMKWKGIKSQQERYDVGQRLSAHGYGPDGPNVDNPNFSNQLQLDTNARNALVGLNEIQGYVKAHPELIGPLQGRIQQIANKIGSQDLVEFISNLSPDQTKQITNGLPPNSAEALGFLTTRLRFLNLAEVRAVIGRAQGVATMYKTLVPAMLGLQSDPQLFKGHADAFRNGLRDVLNETDRQLWGESGPYPPRSKGLQSLLKGNPMVQTNGNQYRVSWDGGKSWQTQRLPPAP